MKKSLAIVAILAALVLNLLGVVAPSAYAGPTGPVIVPGQLATPTAEAAYTVVAAHCTNGKSVEGTVTVNPLAHAQSRLGGVLATSYSGYGQVGLEYIADPGYTFASGQLVSITPSPDLGSALNCTPPDTDKDGVADSVDQCPATPAGAAVDANGCAASQKDSDGDRVVDSIDKCPGTPMGTQVDAVGCALPTVKEATPLAPTATDHTITIPAVTGVIYTNGDGGVLLAGTYGVFQKAGPYHVKEDGTLTVLAKPAEGYTLVGLAHYMWPFVFVGPSPVPPPITNPAPIAVQPVPAPAPPAAPITPVVPAAPVAPAPSAQSPVVAAPQVPVTTVADSSNQASNTAAKAAPSANYIATANTAAGDELGWLPLGSGASLIVLAAALYTRQRVRVRS